MRLFNKMWMSLALVALQAVAFPVVAQDAGLVPRMVTGVDASGVAHHQPDYWPADAGRWNGKGARFHAESRRLVFETFRRDIRGGSIVAARGTIEFPGVNKYFVAGPGTGPADVEGTTVLYLADADGANPSCIGCSDVRDGENGVMIYRAIASPSETPAAPIRQRNGVIYANQNKDLAAWHPNGKWIIAGVEMPRHALTHHVGNSEIGMFNDLWAVSVDGKIWVQLTDFAATWTQMDSVARLPFQCADKRHCAVGCQYETSGNEHPFKAYSCSAESAPPPAIGTMRPTVGNRVHEGGRVAVSWAERVGLDPTYTWGGPLQLALAQIVLVNDLPTLVGYRRNLTPTPAHPDGRDLWSNPGGRQVVGAGYEPWDYSSDDNCLGVASDVFLSTAKPRVRREVGPSSQAFVDVGIWCRNPVLEFFDITAHDEYVYNYSPNGAWGQAQYYGHWEEPVVFAADDKGREFVAFGSSANLTPAWNPIRHQKTFGLDTWLVRKDRSSPAARITYFNNESKRELAYPTTFDPKTSALYLSVVPGGMGGENPPGAIYIIDLP